MTYETMCSELRKLDLRWKTSLIFQASCNLADHFYTIRAFPKCSCTLVRFVHENVLQYCLPYFPWPPWAIRYKYKKPIFVAPPKVIKASTMVTGECCCRRRYSAKLHQCKYCLTLQVSISKKEVARAVQTLAKSNLWKIFFTPKLKT